MQLFATSPARQLRILNDNIFLQIYLLFQWYLNSPPILDTRVYTFCVCARVRVRAVLFILNNQVSSAHSVIPDRDVILYDLHFQERFCAKSGHIAIVPRRNHRALFAPGAA